MKATVSGPPRAGRHPLVLASLALTLLASAAAGQVAPARPTLEVGVEERIRAENYDNALDFSKATVDARHQVRYRSKAWLKLTAAGRAELLVMLNNESRRITTPDTPFKWDETIFESLYLGWRFSDQLSARFGRQDLMRDDGFLVFDGGPLDGSRTAYFNALQVAWSAGPRKLELLAISDPYRDLYLPVFDDQKKPLIEWDERAIGVSLTDTHVEQTTVKAYYFFKTETDRTPRANDAVFQPDLRLHTLGGRATQHLACGWSWAAELAGQAGQRDPGGSRRAWGATGSVTKEFQRAMKPAASLGFLGLSGDDPDTPTDEGWDPLFSRWPKWSEMYIYTLAKERGPAYWSNLAMGLAEARLAPAQPVQLRATYYRMGAFHCFRGNPQIFGHGSIRGDMWRFRADWTGGNWRSHVLGEWLEPGSFYVGSDGGWFFRAEVTLTSKRNFAF